MSKSAASAAGDSVIEYSLHLFEKKDGPARAQSPSNDMHKTLAEAEKLIASGKYVKIDVRQKYFDKKTNRVVDMVLKSLDYKKKSDFLPLMALALFAVLAGGGAFAATYFLTR